MPKTRSNTGVINTRLCQPPTGHPVSGCPFFRKPPLISRLTRSALLTAAHVPPARPPPRTGSRFSLARGPSLKRPPTPPPPRPRWFARPKPSRPPPPSASRSNSATPQAGTATIRTAAASNNHPPLKWTLPEGFAAGPIQWPVPEVKDGFAGKSFVYADTPVLLVDILPPATLQPGTPVTLTADASWQICAETAASTNTKPSP